MKRLIPLFNAHALAFILLIATTIIVYSCKKDLGIDAKKFDQKDLKEIQSWYNQNKATTRVAFNDLQPLWNAVYLNEQPNDLDVYEIKLSNPKKVYLRLSGSAGDAHKKNNIRLLIFKDKANGQIIAGCYMSVLAEEPELQEPNKIHYKDVKRLNGTVMFFSMGGKPENGWEYSAGKIIKRINGTIEGYYGTNGTTLSDLKNPTLSENSGRNRLMVAMPPSCPLPSPVYREVCVGVDGYMECTYVFMYLWALFVRMGYLLILKMAITTLHMPVIMGMVVEMERLDQQNNNWRMP